MAQGLSISDELAIRNVISRYCWALDTGDVEGFVACFAEDAKLVWDAFDVALQWNGHDALRHFATFLRDQPATAGRQHHVTNVLLEATADGARGKAYATVVLRQGDGPHLLNVMGWYKDEFRLENGAWKIARRVIRDWSGPILAEIAGQSGERVTRPLPEPLAGLVHRASKD